MTRPALRARLTSWIDMMLSPPSAKKLSSMPSRSSPRTSANNPHRISSCGVRGPRSERTATPAPPPNAECALLARYNLPRSHLPLPVGNLLAQLCLDLTRLDPETGQLH